MAQTNVQAFSGDVEISGETVLGTATYRKKLRWNRNALAYVYLGNIQTNKTTGIRLDVALNAASSGYEMYQFQITLSGGDDSHAGGKMIYSTLGGDVGSILKSVDIGYVYVGSGGAFEYQLWLKDPTTDTTGQIDAYLNCQGYYNFDTGVSDVAQGGAAPTNFNLGIPGVVVDKFGNVGIGTNDPDTQLEIKNGAAGTLIGLGEHHLKLSTSNALAYSTNDVGPGIVFTQRFSNASAVDRPTGAIYGVKTTANGSNGGGLTFAYQNSSQELTRSITMNHVGNVGIGTTNPGEALHVAGNIRLGAAEGVDDDNLKSIVTTSPLEVHSNAEDLDGLGVSLNLRSGFSDSESNIQMLSSKSNSTFQYISFATATQERMRITSGGNVGIGTNNPSYRLDILTDTNYDGISLRDSTRELLKMAKGSNGAYINMFESGVSKVNISTAGKSWFNGGNVGIGTTNPQQVLEVHGNILLGEDDYASFIHGGTNMAVSSDTSVLIVSDSNDTNGAAPNGHIIFGSGTAIDTNTRNFTYDQAYPSGVPRNEHMRITGDGNVGIGTSSPGSKLDVRGYTRILGNLGIGDRTPDSSYIIDAGNDTNDVSAICRIRSRHFAGLRINGDTANRGSGLEPGGAFLQLTHDGTSHTYGTVSSVQSPDEDGAGGTYTGTTVNSVLVGATGTLCLGGNGSVRMIIDSSVKLSNGTAVSSDDRVKYNEEDISAPLTLISQLKPQKYEKLSVMNGIGTWIPTDEEWENVKTDHEYHHEFGFIAQDVRAVPELAFLVNGEEIRMDTKTVSLEKYSNLTTEEQSTYTTPSYIYTSTEDPISTEQYSNLVSEEQSTYYQLPDEAGYKKNDIYTIEYNKLSPEVQQTYTQSIYGYTKEYETQTPLSLNYQGLFVIAIGAIQELKAKNDTLETQLTSVLARLDALEGA